MLTVLRIPSNQLTNNRMKYTTNTSDPIGVLPAIGECWRHRGYENVYMRINSYDKYIAQDKFNTDSTFISVDMATGWIVKTSKHVTDIEICKSAVFNF